LLVRGPVGLNIVVADAITGEEVAVLDIASPEVPDMTFSPDGSLLAAGAHGESGAVLVWDTATWDLVANLAPPAEEDADGFAWSVDFSPDGALLAATVEGQVEMWDTSTWQKDNTLAVADPDQGEYKELAFRPGGNELAVRGTVFLTEKERWDDAVEIYDLDGNYLRTCCEHVWFLLAASVSYSPDGAQILTAGIDFDTGEGTVFTWDADSGEQLRSFDGHDDVAWDAVFSPDGSLIAAGGDPDVRIWDAATGEELLVLIHGAGVIYDVDFSPDGSRLVSTADTNGLTRVWALELDDLIQIANERLTRTFTEAECEIYDIDPCPVLE